MYLLQLVHMVCQKNFTRIDSVLRKFYISCYTFRKISSFFYKFITFIEILIIPTSEPGFEYQNISDPQD